jgi:hypothetical protein
MNKIKCIKSLLLFSNVTSLLAKAILNRSKELVILYKIILVFFNEDSIILKFSVSFSFIN